MHKSTTARTITNPSPYFSRLRVSASLCSYLSEGSLSAPSGTSPGRLVSMLMLERSFKPGVVQRQKRHFLQLPDICSEPDAADSDYGEQVRRMQPRAAPLVQKTRDDKPVNIYGGQNHHHARQSRKYMQTALHSALQQQQKWHGEVHDHQENGESSPAAESARHIPRNFVFEIAGPNNQEL